jgi:PAS domain S-box-containing protein
MHLAAVVAMLGSWLVGTLHSTARDDVQRELENTLKTLHDSERKLSSLVENTDDIVCSIDTQGSLLVANAAMRQAFARIFGRELVTGQPLFGQMDPRTAKFWAQRFEQVLRGQRLKFEHEVTMGGPSITLETCLGPLPGEDGRPRGMTVYSRDITSRKQAEARLGEMHRTLVDVSRQAGMAEVATGVLHNVGNTLNSVNISANLITEGLSRFRVPKLVQAAELLTQHTANLPAFLTSDPRGKTFPAYLRRSPSRWARSSRRSWERCIRSTRESSTSRPL